MANRFDQQDRSWNGGTMAHEAPLPISRTGVFNHKRRYILMFYDDLSTETGGYRYECSGCANLRFSTNPFPTGFS